MTLLHVLLNFFLLTTLVSLSSGKGYKARKSRARHARLQRNKEARAEKAWEDRERNDAEIKAFEISHSQDHRGCVLLWLKRNDRGELEYLFCPESSKQMQHWIALPGFGDKFVFQSRMENGRPSDKAPFDKPWHRYRLTSGKSTEAEWATTEQLKQLIQNYVDQGHAVLEIKALALGLPRQGYKINSPGTLVERKFSLASVSTSETERALQKHRHASDAQANVQCPHFEKMKRCDAIGDQRSEECCLSKCIQKKPATIRTMDRTRLCNPKHLEGYAFHEFQRADPDSCKSGANGDTQISRMANSVGALLVGERNEYQAICIRVNDAAAQQDFVNFDEADENGYGLNEELEDVLQEMFMAGFNRGLHHME
eukprot:CAMPEP_0202709570 /NCGR_PEP_ID=MMETSP1385-20130828/21665_1 /ASSEMBLY_ACC=CAM_ASM_000861 /TAXON_ID=933848 /ORGANISM="Elphidium margaritaceum" /LENGTH=368 /DNA_ID=CAMNT_0049368863 /DNA_START=35 /DNA_END=1141 /DNA_ORIENTATION=-